MIDANEREEFENIIKDVLAEYLPEEKAASVKENLVIELEEHGLLEVVEPEADPDEDDDG